MPQRHILDLNLEELEEILSEWGEKEFHARQIFSWLYKKGISDFSLMSNLPDKLRRKLAENYFILGIKTEKSLKSCDGTQKLLFKLSDANFIEAVIIPAQNRVTGCVSAQVGCKFACAFCASGSGGWKRNLTTGEIMEEALQLKRHSPGRKLTHLVFMGTGEPLDNYANVLKAIRIINDPCGLNIGARRITISSCGLIPGIKKLAKEGLQVELSISLHAADERIRSQIIPVNKKYPLKELIPACGEYIKNTNRQVTFEYILIKGLNSDLQMAQKLSTMLKGLRLAKVNLIPANPLKGLKVEPPTEKETRSFRDYLLQAGIPATLRRPRGEDIEAACGQLRLRYEKK